MGWKLVRCWIQKVMMAAEHCCLQEVRQLLEGLAELEEQRWVQQREKWRWEAGPLVGCLVVGQVDQLEVRLEELELARALEH